MHGFNWVDIIIVALFMFFILRGFFRGFIREIVALISLIVAFIIATTYASSFAHYLSDIETFRKMAPDSLGGDQASYFLYGLAFAILFFGVMMIGTLIGYSIKLFFTGGILGAGDRILGSLFGFAKALILSLVVVFVLQFTAFSDKSEWQHSIMVKLYQPLIKWLNNTVSPHLSDLQDQLSDPLKKFGIDLHDISEKYREAIVIN